MTFKKYTEDYINLIVYQLKNKNKIFNFIKLCKQIKKNKKKIVIVGNGGSAAIASHFSVDMTKVGGIRCINFNESDLLTCFSNDYGYENWVKEAIKIHGKKGDILISISSSGKSPNIIKGIEEAKYREISTISFTGFKKNNPVSKLSDISYWVESSNYNIIVTIHLICLLNIIEIYKFKILKS